MMTYDDTRLFRLFEVLDPKARRKALRGALSRTATKMRKTALGHVRASLRSSSKELEKQVRKLLYRRVIGFRLTVAGSGKSKLPPILMWGEEGTKRRHTKSRTRVWTRKKRGHYTGQMPRYGFLRRTRDEEVPNVTDTLRQEIVNNIERTARRYGCTVS